jgi:hypothetical protein
VCRHTLYLFRLFFDISHSEGATDVMNLAVLELLLVVAASAWQPMTSPRLSRRPDLPTQRAFQGHGPCMQTFEPQGDPAQFAILFSVVAIPFGYWWLITVPEARLDLAKDKRLPGGQMQEFIQDLREDEAARPVERWFFSKYLAQLPVRRGGAPAPARTDGADGFSEPAMPSSSEAADESTSPSLKELFEPASLKGNATPNVWSGDNPIVVTMGALLGLGIFATIARSNSAAAIDGAVIAAGLIFGLTRLQMK